MIRRALLRLVPLIFGAVLSLPALSAAGNYRNFRVAAYARAYEVQQMKDLELLKARWEVIERQVRFDKIYLETHRDLVVPDQATISNARRFFEARGMQTAGGITLTVNERNRFETFCYSNPEHRTKVKEVVEYTARLFDEFILDDFLFTNCKCDLCIRAKGDRTWSRFRLALLDDAARNLIIGPAKAINPRVKVVIKYPNWYEHFQYLGFNLETEPKLFDGIYTGTETRDPVYTNQHLQQYLGYSIFRYFENIKPGGNGGGWVDPAARGTLDRYAEQIWLTLFAKAPEITLFDYRQLIEPIRQEDGTWKPDTMIARVAGYVFDQVDGFIGRLGAPVGVKSYKPFHSSGEDFLHTYLGMVGIPIDLRPEFPAEAGTVLLTESARFDPGIVEKIKRQLAGGKSVVITSGLLRALHGKGIEDIVELEYTDRKAATRDFWRRSGVVHSDDEVVIPQIRYATNDAWELVSCLTKGIGYPILLQASYSKGVLYVLTIPENFGDLYKLPAEVLTDVRQVLTRDLFVRAETPAQVALFVYDNDSFIVESFLPHGVQARITTERRITRLQDLLSGQELTGYPQGERTVFELPVRPNSYRVFSAR